MLTLLVMIILGLNDGLREGLKDWHFDSFILVQEDSGVRSIVLSSLLVM